MVDKPHLIWVGESTLKDIKIFIAAARGFKFMRGLSEDLTPIIRGLEICGGSKCWAKSAELSELSCSYMDVAYQLAQNWMGDYMHEEGDEFV